MTTTVALLVLLSALLHASWNVFMKASADRLSTLALFKLASGAIALPFVLALPLPGPEAWPFLGVTVVLHVCYQLFLIRAYDHGDLAQVYPLARGTAPLLVTIAAWVFVGERLGPLTLAGVLVLVAGIMSLALKGGRRITDDSRAVAYSLATAAFIASYTVVDGLGARAAGSAHSYAAWLFALEAIPITLIVLARRRDAFVIAVRRNWRPGFAAGAISMAGFWIAIWALSVAPMGPVSALRETSVVLAPILAAIFVRERFTAWRAGACLAVLAGAVLVRL